jgi:hypothetical protein
MGITRSHRTMEYVKPVDISRVKKGLSETKLMSSERTVRRNTSETCIEE